MMSIIIFVVVIFLLPFLQILNEAKQVSNCSPCFVHPILLRKHVAPRTKLAMFSGIVEEVGTVVRPPATTGADSSATLILEVSGPKVVKTAHLGCSIAVNGVCLTVVDYDTQKFAAGVSLETLRRSNLGDLKQGDLVNLEPGLARESRNSGHFVQGHIDATGELLERWNDGDSVWFKIRFPSQLANLIVEKGFIAIDGTSLTVCEVNPMEGWFTFMMIRHTQNTVIMPEKKIGDRVNLETDIIGKYVAQSLRPFLLKLGSVEDRMLESNK